MLTEDDVRRLIAAGEQLDVEFRGEERDAMGDDALAEAVVCQANARGGVLLVGVEDDRRITGARPRHATYTDARRLERTIANLTVPSVPTECGVLSIDGRDVIAIEIPRGCPVTGTSAGVYKRRGLDAHGRAQCLPFLVHEMQSREASRGAQDYTALIVPDARWEDLDPLEIERLRQTVARNAGRADAALRELAERDLLRALGLAEGRDDALHVRVAGVLMLGREEALARLVPTHEVAFQVLGGGGTRIVVNDFFRWPLVRVAHEVFARFEARNEQEELTVGPVSVGIPHYSPAGFREALHNALIHRDYTRLGAVHVQWREGEIEIGNPGGFPDEVRLENLLVTTPRPRNPLLADAFKRIGLVERTGRGIDTIYEGQLRYGRPAPDYSRTTAGSVQVVLPGGPPDLALARLIIERDRPDRRVTLEEMLVVNTVERERRIGIGRAAELMQRHEGAARAVLERLVEAGVLEGKEERRERVYYFSAATYRALGAPEAHVRMAGIEPIRREQMILQYVDTHGRITRGQAAELIQVEGREARAVLEKLVNRGELEVRGEKRGAHYARPGGVMAAGQKF